jgi:hypothetical protein
VTCKHCTEFFKRFRCSAATHGECDCPKCQGYCKCEKLPGTPEWLSAKSTGPRWQWEDAQGVTRQGYMEKVTDHGGTDVTYFMRHADTGTLNLVSGSRAKKMQRVETPK